MSWGFLRDSYDAVADAYAAAFDDELDAKPFDRAWLDDLAAGAADPVVDLGCGPGQVGRHLRHRGRHVIGMDLSPAMARVAGGRLDGAVAADLRRLPIVEGGAGAVVAFYALIHVPRPEVAPALGELRRALRPGGDLLLAVHQGTGELAVDELLGAPVPFRATLFELDELVEATTAAGVEVLRAERRSPYPTEHPTDRLYVWARRPG